MSARFRALAGSYRGRLALGYALIIALLAGAWAWSLYGPLTVAVVDLQRQHLYAIARTATFALDRHDATPQRTVREIGSGSALRVTVVAADGRVLADSAVAATSTMDNHGGRPEIRDALAGKVGYATRTSTTLGIPLLYVAVPTMLDGRRVALRVSEPLGRIDQLAASARGTGLILLALALATAVAVGVRLSLMAAEPVLRLTQAAESMAAGELSVDIPAGSGDLSGLTRALTALRDDIREKIGDLQQGQATLRAVLDGLQVTVFLFDGGRITLANVAASRMFTAPLGGWHNVPLAETGLPTSLAAEVGGALHRAEYVSAEVGPDPERRFYRVTAVPLESDGQDRRALVTIADITEVRRLDQVRRDFVANASHELKTPTAAIQLLADSATTAAADGDVEQALAFTSQIGSQAERLRGLVLDLLDLGRLESIPGPGTITNVRTSVANALAAHRPAARASGLPLGIDDGAVTGEDVYAAAEPADMAVALDNLLANAIAYTERGGVTTSIDADEATVTVTISDTGIGIPEEHLPRVFERFYRVDSARSRQNGGTGLGLSLVKHVAERAGGTVDIASEVGVGTTVTLRLPRAR